MNRTRPSTCLSGFVLTVLAVAGCAGSDDDDTTGPAKKTARPAEDTVFRDQVQTLDRARGVEQQLMDSAATQRKALEEQER
jgi:hypothetical protein